ncbi:phosphonate C-P lyase system protein PhnH [Neisseriaceae bacterium TC5R-5]|nr:phosphonate C-P lyase system protein PhnH [Neisseriaceae bacterium TC5R-5]
MMNVHDLSALGAGFSNLALGSQQVFRAVLDALAHPGRAIALQHDAQTPDIANGHAAAILLALLDADTTLWLSPRLHQSDVAAYLRFHTGCTLVVEPALADFAWLAAADELPALACFAQGTALYPERSTTCLIEVDRISAGHGWTLCGPGIREPISLQVSGLPAGFAEQWADNHASFPCGVDVLLLTRQQLFGLPRTTQLTAYSA